MKTDHAVLEKDALNWYLSRVGKTKPLSSKEESDLARRIRKGDYRAAHMLVLANLRFVVSVARNYQNQGLSIDDLISEGNLGLIKAARRFDEKKNFRFISYAVWWIRQGILQALADQSRLTRIPTNRVSIIQRLARTQSQLEQRFSRQPNVAELAQALGLDEKSVEEILQIIANPISLDSPFDAETEQGLIDVIEDKNQQTPEESTSYNSLREDIKNLLTLLNEREREIISLYFGIGEDSGHTLDDIGRKVKLTRERVRQLKESALHRLKHSYRIKTLRTYLS